MRPRTPSHKPRMMADRSDPTAGPLEMAGGIGQLPEVPRGSPVPTDQRNRISAVVEGPPGLVGVIGSLRPNGGVTPSGCLLGGDRTGGGGVKHHIQARLSDPTEEVEVFEPEKPGRVG